MAACKDPIKEADRRRKLSIAHTGKKHSEEHCKKISESQRGEKHHFFGKKLSEEHKRKIGENSRARSHITSAKLMGHPVSLETRTKMSKSQTGKTIPLITRRKISESTRGEKGNSWKGGISFEPYCVKFSKEFKERCRTFFNHTCVECGTPQNGKKLGVHHINFNKMSCCDETIPLFVALCDKCHPKTNHNRSYWEDHFTEIINGFYEGKCYFTKDEMNQYLGIL